jgi:MFS family permease
MNGRASRLVPYLLAFFSSLCIMILELVASRLVARHVGASLSVWTSVIGIMLGGICLGNVLGGRLADRMEPTRALGPLYALGAALTLGILAMNGVVGYLPGRTYLPLSIDTIVVVSLDFLVPGTVLGMIGPIVAKIAVERARRSGGALGDVYFFGAVGSIAGTFLAGFVLMYLAPTSTIVILVAAGLLFVGLVLVRDGELSGGIVTAIVMGVALLVGFAGLVCLGLMLMHKDTSPQGQMYLATAILIFEVALGFLGVAFVAATAASVIELDSRAVAAAVAVTLLGLGSVEGMGGPIRAPGLFLGSTKINLLAIGGALIAFGLAVDGISRLFRDMAEARSIDEDERAANPLPATPEVNLNDLCALAFFSSLGFMTLEMVAGRLVTRNLGSSIYGWTSVIGVLLGGLSLGNWLGGRIANRVTDGARAATLFLIASIFTSAIILAEKPRTWMVRNPIPYFFQKADPVPLGGKLSADGSISTFLSSVSSMDGIAWPIRILFWVSVEFLLPAVAMGTIGPVVAKLAVERVRARTKGTGAAIGKVYAWGMVGSILGTFLAGFFLINVFGTKGVILLLATMLAITATVLGKVRHAAWAGIPMGLCVIAFMPSALPEKSNVKIVAKARDFLIEHGKNWGLREADYDPDIEKYGVAYLDESNYYYIKITNEPVDGGGQKRTLVLDNLIHGYYIKDQPKRLDYDYEHIYALVTHRVMQARARAAKVQDEERLPLSTLFLGGGSYTFPRYLQAVYPKTEADVAEIDPAVKEANHRALWLPRDTTIKTTLGDARQFVDNRRDVKYDLVFGDAFNDFSVPWHLTTREFNERVNSLLSDDGVYMINIIDKYLSDRKAVFDALYTGEEKIVEQALEDAGVEGTRDVKGGTEVGIAHELAKKVLISLDDKKLGVGTTDFARRADKAVEGVTKITSAAELERVLTKAFEEAKIPMRGTREELVAAVVKVLREDEDAKQVPGRIPALADAIVDADLRYNNDVALPAREAAKGIYEAREFGSFLGSWVETAKLTFGDNVYVFGTDSTAGKGQRETFVVVASRKPLELAELGSRMTDLHFYDRSETLVEPKVYNADHMKAVKLRSRGIILTDDYAPVENLLAPVARTRAQDD